MSLKPNRLRDGCTWLIRELTRLSQLNRPLSIEQFYEWTENETFLNEIFTRYGHYIVALNLLDAKDNHHDAELISYIDNALMRHTNVITSGTYGVVDDAYLLAINVLVAISREADEF